MVPPKISIVTPSYNQGEFIEETIRSIINQSYPNLEYIIIDGGSTDNSIDIIKKYEQHLAFWVSEKDRGQSEAINKGFRRATGDIICWLNSDDILLPDALNKVATCFTHNDDLIFLNGYTVIIDSNSEIIDGHFILKQNKWYAHGGIYYISQPAMFWKRSIFETIGFLKEDYHASMDREFVIRIFEKNYKVGQMQKFLAGFRKHSMAKNAGSPESLQNYERDKKELFKLYDGRYKQEPLILFRIVYLCEKLVRGLYLKNWIFKLRWKGKKIGELTKNNCQYL